MVKLAQAVRNFYTAVVNGTVGLDEIEVTARCPATERHPNDFQVPFLPLQR
jgi:hypothetical protein